MSSVVTDVLAVTKTWPVEDQLALFHGVWECLVDSGWRPELGEELRAELDRRLDHLDAHPEKGLTWEQVLQRLRLPTET